MQKLLKIISQTRLDGEELPFDMDPVSVLRRAERSENFFKLKRNIYFCCYKTKYDGLDAIMFYFAVQFNDPANIASMNESILSVIDLMESLLTPISHYRFYRNLDGINKNIVLLKFIKVYDEKFSRTHLFNIGADRNDMAGII